jgi:5-oxoprolinase (ATP-hydrolysing)
MLNSRFTAATVAGSMGNSQCIMDALFGALEVMAAQKRAMNNFTFGNEYYQYYEIISGDFGTGITALDAAGKRSVSTVRM